MCLVRLIQLKRKERRRKSVCSAVSIHTYVSGSTDRPTDRPTDQLVRCVHQIPKSQYQKNPFLFSISKRLKFAPSERSKRLDAFLLPPEFFFVRPHFGKKGRSFQQIFWKRNVHKVLFMPNLTRSHLHSSREKSSSSAEINFDESRWTEQDWNLIFFFHFSS